jgi:hypothetical protein
MDKKQIEDLKLFMISVRKNDTITIFEALQSIDDYFNQAMFSDTKPNRVQKSMVFQNKMRNHRVLVDSVGRSLVDGQWVDSVTYKGFSSDDTFTRTLDDFIEKFDYVSG